MSSLRNILTPTLAALSCLGLAQGASAASRHTSQARVAAHDSGPGTVYLSSSVYTANENAGRFAITVDRSNDSGSEIFYYGVTNKSSEAGQNFNKVPNTEASFAPGQSSYTFYVTIDDQGINGPMRKARAYIYGASPSPLGSPTQATIELLQNDPLDTTDTGTTGTTTVSSASTASFTPVGVNPLGYAPPTDGDPLQNVNWFIFGDQSPAGKSMATVAKSNPGWASDLHTIADTPGSGTYRFWMWNQSAGTLASTVEKYLADDEQQQPNTTVALSSYSLVHGKCQDPSAIKGRYEAWIRQLADGIGNFRVVMYLEEDSVIESHCLSRQQLAVREQELSYAVQTLSKDPHLLLYMDAGAPDAWLNARQTANILRKSDVAQATGFFVNATHNDWTTTDIHFGQQIAKLVGGKHFIVQTDDNGRGPLVPKDRKLNGNEDLCNPPGRGTGPLSWDTGYQYVDGFMWFNNPGNSDGPCGAGDPPVSTFWAQYAVGLVQHGTSQVTGPRFSLLKSQTDM
jgi:endoglucanase